MEIRVSEERWVAELAAFLERRGYVVVRTGRLTLLASPTPTSRATPAVLRQVRKDLAAWKQECPEGRARIQHLTPSG